MTNGHEPLVPGTIREIVEGKKPSSISLQVIFIKPIDKDSSAGGSGGSRYKVAVSDSVNFIQAMVVSPMSLAFDQKLVEQWSIVKVTSYQLNTLKGHTFLVLGNMSMDEVVRGTVKIGEPTNIEQSPAAGKPAAFPAEEPLRQSVPAAVVAAGTPLNPPPFAPNPAAHPPPASLAAGKPAPFQSNIYSASSGDNKRSFAESSFGGGPSSSAAAPPESLQSIANLSPYHNRWAIKARVINKSEIKKFANAKGEGKLFSATCIDQSGEIRMTGFGDAVDKFFDIVQEGQVYYISNAQVRIAKRQFGVQNEYEIHLEAGSLVTLAQDGTDAVPAARYSFVPISQIVNMEKDSNCDVVGIVKEVGELGNIVTRTTQKNLSKRDITIVDTSNCSIRVTLWGAQAENYHDIGNCPVIAIKGARISDYNGRTLSTSASSMVSLNPDVREAHELRGWYDSQGMHESSRLLSTSSAVSGGGLMQRDERKAIAQIKDEFLGTGEKPDFFTVLATIAYIKSDAAISYTACPTEGCNKKVLQDGPNMWRCEKCQKLFDRCDHRYILSLQISDYTGQTWVNAFNETGEELLGKTAEEMYYLRMNDDGAYAAIFKDALFKKYMFRLRAKQESYQGEMKLRCNVLSVLPINPVAESQMLIEKIQQAN